MKDQQIIDRGWNRIKREMIRDTAPMVKVGVQSDAGSHKGKKKKATVVDIAIFNEFGTRTIPERSFIRSTADEQRRAVADIAEKELDRILTGKSTINESLRIMGEFMEGRIKRKIIDLRTPPNAPATIARKKSSNPLIDTGQLKNVIRYEIEK